MIQNAIREVIDKKNLSYEDARTAMTEIMDGTATQAQIAAFLMGLRMKGETIDEITACAVVMREKAVKLTPGRDVIDIVGTGGDEVGTFNISTTAAFVIAAAGIPVAKHGNRSVSSKSGAADVLEKLGVNLLLRAEQSAQVLRETDMCFMFAQFYHASMKYAAPVRKELGVRTIFNILGPLSNPAGASLQLLGVYDPQLAEPLAKVLHNLGVKRGLVVCGSDGLDEVTLTGKTLAYEISGDSIAKTEIDPAEFGLKSCALQELIGGTPAENAEITRDILQGKIQGPKRDIVVLNAGLGIYLGKPGMTMQEGIRMAEFLIDSGAAAQKLEQFIRATIEVVK